MTSKRDKQQIGQRLLAAFRDAGAVEIAPDILLPAETLLDLYGEDIRARAYVTQDPVRAEMMLRPDFTVPVVQAHMENGAEPARYCYLGEVFRKQDTAQPSPDNPRDNEYLQCGFELFSRHPGADAEVFALFHRLLSPHRLSAETGDMGLVLDAVRACRSAWRGAMRCCITSGGRGGFSACWPGSRPRPRRAISTIRMCRGPDCAPRTR